MSMSTIAWFRLFSILITIHRPIHARPLDRAPPLPLPPPLPPQPPRHTYQQITFFMSDVLGDIGNPSPESEPAGTNTLLPSPKPRGNFPPVDGIPRPEPSTRVPVSGPGDNIAAESDGWFPHLSSLQALEFGAVTAVDEELREGGLSTAPLVGRARGIYVTIPEDPGNHMVAMTAEFADGEPENSIRFFGIHHTGDRESHDVAVIGGTGKYEGANGYATVKSAGSSVPGGNGGAGASRKSLQFTVFLS